MALQKIKPQSPDKFLGKTVGDNTLARLAHVNEIVSSYRRVLEFDVPQLDSVINISPCTVETIVVFRGPITDDFTINVTAIPGCDLGPGDRMYIFLEGTGTVTFTGDITLTLCNEADNEFSIGDPACLEVIFNGSQFIGIDVC